MQKIILKMRDRNGSYHNFSYPWSHEEIYNFAKISVGHASIYGIAKDVNTGVHVTELQEKLPMVENIIQIMSSGFKVVYAPTKLEAVRMMFNYDLKKATKSVFDPSIFPAMTTWTEIIERLNSLNRLKALGMSYFADMGETV